MGDWMKIERMREKPTLAEFFKRHCPKTLGAIRTVYGYACNWHVIRKGWLFGDPIARIDDNVIEIFHPEFTSDITDVVEKYEALTNAKVLIKIWENTGEWK